MRIEKLIQKHAIKTNSKNIQKGDIFVCALGQMDKNEYIEEAINNGASMVVTDKKYYHKKVFCCENTDAYLKEILDLKYNYPLSKINLIGVTGTDGKTTTVSILKDMLNGASIGTNGVEYHQSQIDLHNTTPDLVTLYDCFDKIRKQNIFDVAMEVSSESYLTKRIPYLKFDVGIFLNISNEHLDKHKTFTNYLECKKELLRNSKKCLINNDSEYFKDVTDGLDNYLTFGHNKGDLQILKEKMYYDKTIIKFKYQHKNYTIVSPLSGEYNVINLMAAVLCLLSMGYKINDVIQRICLIKKIPGRMESFSLNGKNIFIDYAHTLNATKKILLFLKKYSRKKIILVVGCAGDRYREKRPLIGDIALKYSKKVIFTSDDPRWENPSDIIKEMLAKTKRKNYYIVLSRSDAIKTALNIAGKNDLVVILGKGRDNYMAIQNELVPYSDIDVLNAYFNMKLS